MAPPLVESLLLTGCTVIPVQCMYIEQTVVTRPFFFIYQGRLFSYHDTHLHRLGTNYLQLPVNCPYRARVSNYQRDGPQTFDNQGNR